MGQYLRKGDIVAVAIVVLLLVISAYAFSPAFRGGSGEPTELVVRSIPPGGGGEVLHRIPLPVERTFWVDGVTGGLMIEISGTQARVESSEGCPREICHGVGWMTLPGERSICAPNQLVVELTGAPVARDIDDVLR